jgi:hypothetical protein
VVVERRRQRALERRWQRVLKSLGEILGVGISHRRGTSATLCKFPLYSDIATISLAFLIRTKATGWLLKDTPLVVGLINFQSTFLFFSFWLPTFYLSLI